MPVWQRAAHNATKIAAHDHRVRTRSTPFTCSVYSLITRCLCIRRTYSSFFRTTTKNDVVGAFFLFLLFIVPTAATAAPLCLLFLFIMFLFIGIHFRRIEISFGRGLAGLDNAKAGRRWCRVSQLSLRSPRGRRLCKIELCERKIQGIRIGMRRAQVGPRGR
jgi:hypothetical protein